ncbi:MAG: hypothetical protein FJ398_12970 [Verrucomicrobia bacterium]|nr:hypothetical protein [Verrucomicrobiota bacterium]
MAAAFIGSEGHEFNVAFCDGHTESIKQEKLWERTDGCSRRGRAVLEYAALNCRIKR